ncbi:MAG TPA: YicC/YloC family endoribonuclease [Verrucomicrobiae bacterium]|jgi:uncharacterized protein (TIGR00255 family)|nr:YicC/YloC family endoribonuclease [Verrucomicrobiae bacterium]
MTAFARITGSGREEENWLVEARSLNHRFFEFSLKSPSLIYPLEVRIRDFFQEKIQRGKVSVCISQANQDENEQVLNIDENVVEFYLNAARELGKKYHLQDDLSLRDVLALPKVFSPDKKSADQEQIWKRLEPVLIKTRKALLKAKETEGEVLAADMVQRLDQIGKTVRKIEKQSVGSSKRLHSKLTARLAQLIEEKDLDQERVSREVAFLAERCDITEEIVRLKAHLDVFRDRLKSEGEMGRELDFLCQEINREVNTIGSKSQVFEISSDVIFIKKELEKIREQVQNIE